MHIETLKKRVDKLGEKISTIPLGADGFIKAYKRTYTSLCQFVECLDDSHRVEIASAAMALETLERDLGTVYELRTQREGKDL